MARKEPIASVTEHPSSLGRRATAGPVVPRWMLFHLRLNHAERGMAILVLTLPFALSSAALAWFFTVVPQASPYADPAAMATYLEFVVAWTLLLGLTAAVLFIGRTGRLNVPNAELVGIWLSLEGLSVPLFYFGAFTAPLLIGAVCIGILSVIICERRPVIVAVSAFIVTQAILMTAEQLDWVSYAPLVQRSPVYAGQLHWSWNWGVGVFSLLLGGVAFLFSDSLVRQIHTQAEELKRLAVTDPLTGVANRRRFFEDAERVMAQVARHQRSATCLLIDIDHFKRLNDTFGHQLGDEALRLVAQTVAGALRTEDRFARYGGEEFVALLPDTDTDGGQRVAERLRREVAKLIIPHHGQTVTMTVSVGLACTPGHTQPKVAALLAAADAALYAAKDAGRDRVVVAQSA